MKNKLGLNLIEFGLTVLVVALVLVGLLIWKWPEIESILFQLHQQGLI